MTLRTRVHTGVYVCRSVCVISMTISHAHSLNVAIILSTASLESKGPICSVGMSLLETCSVGMSLLETCSVGMSLLETCSVGMSLLETCSVGMCLLETCSVGMSLLETCS